MSSRCSWLICLSCLIGFNLLSASAEAVVIADWRFGSTGGNFLDDSTGNYHLEQGGSVLPAQSSDGMYSSFAIFDGSLQYLKSNSALDLSPYNKLRFSWAMKVAGSNEGILLESSSNHFGTVGAFVFAANFQGTPGNSLAAIYTGNNLLNETFTHLGNAWHTYVVDVDMTNASAANVTRVLVDGVLQTNAGSPQNLPPVNSFFSDQIMYVGSRDGGSIRFVGSLVNLKIETIPVPEPSTVLFAGMAAAITLSQRLRRRTGNL